MSEFLIPNQKRIDQYRQHMIIGETVLEIGTGSGVIAQFCLQRGAKQVVAVDINPHAIEFVRGRFPNIDARHSDLFEAVAGKFDTIVFAAPWSVGVINKPLDYALYDTGVVARFLKEAPDFLELGGSIWLQYCDAFPENFNQLSDWIGTAGLRVYKEWQYEHFGRLVGHNVNVILYQLTLNSLLLRGSYFGCNTREYCNIYVPRRINKPAANTHIITAIAISNICHARGFAKTGASQRAPKPKLANQSALALHAPAMKTHSMGAGCCAPTLPMSNTVSRYTCGLRNVKAAA